MFIVLEPIKTSSNWNNYHYAVILFGAHLNVSFQLLNMLSYAFIAVTLAIAARAENCVPASQLQQCKTVPVLIPQSSYTKLEASFKLVDGLIGATCPALSGIKDNVYINSASCAASVSSMSGVKECNPGKPAALCKRSCMAALKKRDELVKNVKCDQGSLNTGDESMCEDLPDTDCFEIESSNGMRVVAAPAVLIAALLSLL